jgi:GTPase
MPAVMALARSSAKTWRNLHRWARLHRNLSSMVLPQLLRLDLSPSLPLEKVSSRFASVAVVGYPSAGKSSLMNRLVGGRVAAVSRKVQTTRRRIVGLLTEGETQLAFLDTPGVIERRYTKDLGAERKEFVREAWGAIADADLTVFVVDVSRSKEHWARAASLANQVLALRKSVAAAGDSGDKEEGLSSTDSPVPQILLALNKADSVRPRGRILEAAGFFAENIDNFSSVIHDARPFIISAWTGRGVDSVKQELLQLAPPGEFLMERHSSPAEFEDAKDTVLEHIWQAALHRLHQELPYQIQFETDSWKVLQNGDIAASFILRVGRQAHVPMVVGCRGDNIRFIAEEAGTSASEILGRRVYLSLRVAPAKVNSR